jgi:predicted dehydrogenase
VLRYAPFYAAIKQKMLDGEIGKMITLSTAEYVSYHHFSTCFVRGKWGNSKECRTSMLMAKCCHDMDLVSWLTSGVKPVRVDSFGGLRWFCAENAPAGSGTHCLRNCPLVDTCDFSAKRMYLDHPERWSSYVWPEFDYRKELNTPENRLAKLMEENNPHSRCTWKCNNDQVDRQSVIVEFENGCVATHQLIADTCRADRRVHIVGTEGEIEGFMSENKFVLRKHDLRPGHDYSEEVIDVSGGDGHGGGDLRLVADFVALINGEAPSISSTDLSDSVIGNQLVFAADAAMTGKNRIEEFDHFCEEQA